MSPTSTPENPDEQPLEQSEALDQTQPEDSLVDRGVDDVLDEGYTTPERWSAGQGFGTTAEEQARGETLEDRLRQEQPESAGPDGTQNQDFERGETGDERSGRLVDPNGGIGEDSEAALVGDDVGIDGAAASAEEAAVHTIDDDAEGWDQ